MKPFKKNGSESHIKCLCILRGNFVFKICFWARSHTCCRSWVLTRGGQESLSREISLSYKNISENDSFFFQLSVHYLKCISWKYQSMCIKRKSFLKCFISYCLTFSIVISCLFVYVYLFFWKSRGLLSSCLVYLHNFCLSVKIK